MHVLQDSGAWVDIGAILAPFMTRPMASGVYDIPNIEVRTTSVATNTTPVVAYRGAGRPEATAALERAMDMFAAEIGKDAAEVRRINLIPKFLEPHATSIGQTYDVGDYEESLNRVCDSAQGQSTERNVFMMRFCLTLVMLLGFLSSVGKADIVFSLSPLSPPNLNSGCLLLSITV
jgi:CO/xanthine dehydrogenase Mo-binding subunit